MRWVLLSEQHSSGQASPTWALAAATRAAATLAAATLAAAILLLGACAPASPQFDCSVELLRASYSPEIGTVGIVEFSTSASTLRSATIEFGIDERYGMAAPVDLTEPRFRTLLLGMKAATGPYHFRIHAVTTDDTRCSSVDYHFEAPTGPAPNELARPLVTTFDRTALAGGFLLTAGYEANTPDDYAFIVDGDGDLVWWFKPPGFGDLTTARMSYDGRHMWITHANVPSVEGRVGRVRMDGSEWEDLREEFPKQHHDLIVLPDETVAYLAYAPNECDDLILRSPDGTKRTLLNTAAPLGNPVVCHGNALQYSPWNDTFVISDNDHAAYLEVDKQGNVSWVLGGGEQNDFDRAGGGASTFAGNHNFHLFERDRLLFFNNGTQGALVPGIAAVARELRLDLEGMTTTEVWSYSADPAVSSPILGDTQRLPNGNTLVAYSAAGQVHEVDADGRLLQELNWGKTKRFGYVTHRASLYGPPPR